MQWRIKESAATSAATSAANEAADNVLPKPGRWTSDETRYLLRILRNIVGPSSVGRVAERMGRTCYDVAVKVIQLRAAGFPLNTIRPGMAMYLPG
ncbi:hypothetical protein ColTof4_14316 [Colletotrichum tofieldiae]|nr:hypothetical protein ColTof4_14316 [Colletotrichum tofieldiae]